MRAHRQHGVAMEAVLAALTLPIACNAAHATLGPKESPRAKYDIGAETKIQNTKYVFLNYATKVKAIRAATNEYHDP